MVCGLIRGHISHRACLDCSWTAVSKRVFLTAVGLQFNGCFLLQMDCNFKRVFVYCSVCFLTAVFVFSYCSWTAVSKGVLLQLDCSFNRFFFVLQLDCSFIVSYCSWTAVSTFFLLQLDCSFKRVLLPCGFNRFFLYCSWTAVSNRVFCIAVGLQFHCFLLQLDCSFNMFFLLQLDCGFKRVLLQLDCSFNRVFLLQLDCSFNRVLLQLDCSFNSFLFVLQLYCSFKQVLLQLNCNFNRVFLVTVVFICFYCSWTAVSKGGFKKG